MALKIRGKSPHRDQIKAMTGKTKKDPRYRPGKTWEQRKKREDRRRMKASISAIRRGGAPRSVGFLKKG